MDDDVSRYMNLIETLRTSYKPEKHPRQRPSLRNPTFRSRILLSSPAGMAITQTALITNRLKAAEPTMVPGPRSLASKSLPMTSMTDSRISGAEEPRAMRVRLATASLQILTSITSGSSSFSEVKYTWRIGQGGGVSGFS